MAKTIADDTEEKIIYQLGYQYIVGIDESGMGCFAGDVYVGAVIFKKHIDYKHLLPGLNDSKKKTHAQRLVLYDQIQQHALTCSYASASVAEINVLNIYKARCLAALRAIEKLKIPPDYILIDGDKVLPNTNLPQSALVKGDQRSISIAAASILAKVQRDEHIDSLSEFVHPDYDWKKNKSYYCKETIDALQKHGKTLWHRDKYCQKFLLK